MDRHISLAHPDSDNKGVTDRLKTAGREIAELKEAADKVLNQLAASEALTSVKKEVRHEALLDAWVLLQAAGNTAGADIVHELLKEVQS